MAEIFLEVFKKGSPTICRFERPKRVGRGEVRRKYPISFI
jgi:hypothetical protein